MGLVESAPDAYVEGMTNSVMLMPSQSVWPEGWRESLDPFAPLPSGQTIEQAEEHARHLTALFAERCSEIDAQLRMQLPKEIQLEFMAGVGAWSVLLPEGTSQDTFQKHLADIAVEIAPNASFSAL